ncbi:MAG: WhiB family transcriptional regulator [Actinomycetota bacterium]|nr:WhiB family transcriptional regulator [Actinomycetota bacterium]
MTGPRGPRISATKAAQLKPPRRTWIDLAACIHHDPAMWDLDNPSAWYRATTICQACPVKQQCLDDGLDNPAASGIYAGVPLDRGKPTSHRQADT